MIRSQKTFVVLVFILALCATAAPAQKPATDSLSTPDLMAKTESYLRELFAWGPDYHVTLGPLASSSVPGLEKVPVKVTYQGKSQTGTVYVTQDGKYMFRGDVENMSQDPFQTNRSKLTISGSPYIGPADAKVTVVIFSDFECPHCLELHEILKAVIPEFPGVKFVFKDFPLTDIHPWAMNAALAARCVYQLAPTSYPKMQDAIFENQEITSADNAWSELTQFAGTLGIRSDTLHACMVAPATKAAVDADLKEGKDLEVDSTPTLFINGRPLIGGDQPTLEHLIRFALAPDTANAPPTP